MDTYQGYLFSTDKVNKYFGLQWSDCLIMRSCAQVSSTVPCTYLIQWSLSTETVQGPRKCGLCGQVVFIKKCVSVLEKMCWIAHGHLGQTVFA